MTAREVVILHATLKQLRYFVVAGELKSVTRAAEQLHVSQPSISAAIAHLETAAGVQLFVRHHAQGLSLTTAGTQFLARARNLLYDADSLMQFAVSLGEDIAGPLNLVAFHTFAPIFMPRLMQAFLEQFPRVEPQCDEGHQVDIVEGLRDGRYELGLIYDMQVPDDIEFEALCRFPPYAAVATDHPLASHERLSIDTLSEYPMVLLDWPMSRDYFLSLFVDAPRQPKIAHRATSLGMVRGLVANGFGFSLLNVPPGRHLSLDGKAFRTIPLEGDVRALTVGMATLKGIRLSPAAQAMVNFLKKSELGPVAAEGDA
ncbi:LysR family transcriptional regulator [Salinicola rhizosphaerae]|uniref:LysR family transcriptional regulator n=1 Tax=Salinicola rhizosphaerae TaxID=1443141 RepID=A0ABQ3EDK3_9GAMM|nr:LysR family transcriptional regulator [Salinicola rhizosphaerae]GHB34388.1 LysR family transcriptional regulator [Salinicola rhizosphaerae]